MYYSVLITLLINFVLLFIDSSVTLSCRFLVSSPAFDAIKALTSEIHKKFKDGNLDGIPANYTENAVIYMNEENPIIGRQGE